jgi:hypothetical protein
MTNHQKENPKGEVQTETGEALKGPKPLNLDQQQHQGAQGEQAQSIGVPAHAKRDPAKKKTGEF